jgi:hypothetical protein
MLCTIITFVRKILGDISGSQETEYLRFKVTGILFSVFPLWAVFVERITFVNRDTRVHLFFFEARCRGDWNVIPADAGFSLSSLTYTERFGKFPCVYSDYAAVVKRSEHE